MCRRSVAIRFRAVLSSTTWGDRRVSDLGGQKGQELCLSLGYDGSFPWCFMARKTHPKRLEQDWGTGRFKMGLLKMHEKDEIDRGAGTGVRETPGLTTQSAFWVSLLSVSSEL